MTVHHQLLVSPQVKQPAGGIIRACPKGVPIGEKLQEQDVKTDVRLMYSPEAMYE